MHFKQTRPAFFNFHEIRKQKTHQDAPVSTTSLDTWLRDIINWNFDDRQRVILSDESRFQLFRRPHEVMDSSCQQGNVQNDGGCFIMVR